MVEMAGIGHVVIGRRPLFYEFLCHTLHHSFSVYIGVNGDSG